jgi:succinyl-CoA synthetase beta subunit
VDEAKKILSTSGLDIVSASDLEEAAQKVVACLKG